MPTMPSFGAIFLCLFLILFGVLTFWGPFKYSDLIVGVTAIAAAICILFGK